MPQLVKFVKEWILLDKNDEPHLQPLCDHLEDAVKLNKVKSCLIAIFTANRMRKLDQNVTLSEMLSDLAKNGQESVRIMFKHFQTGEKEHETTS